jgi:glyoxylase-like metal-dependent hydrolase (beta-lactamase superfamily II)
MDKGTKVRVNFHWCQAGCCTHPEFITIRGGKFSSTEFPSHFGLIRHPTRGYILYDTGYSSHFHEATKKFPEKFYALLTPVKEKSTESALIYLQKLGISPSEISLIIISHLHADHIAGIKDFPQATFLCLQASYQTMLRNSRIKNLMQGILPVLFPTNFCNRVNFVDECHIVSLGSEWNPYDSAFDLLGDQSLLGVPLPGHAEGHMGLIFKSENDRNIFLVGDAAWHLETIRSLRFPHPVVRFLSHNHRLYCENIAKLNKLYRSRKDLVLLPSHCIEFRESIL